jgi:flavodoxin
MKTLVVYYSRTDTTRKVAEALAQKLEADLEAINDTQKRSGILGFLKSGYQSSREKLTTLEPPVKNPADYDLVVIGTPIWGGKMSVPVRTYLHQEKDKLKNVAFFCTFGNSGMEGTFQGMEEYIRNSPMAILGLRKKDVDTGLYKLDEFVNSLKLD